MTPVSLRVLTWNLKHGRAVPSAGHDLLDEFTAALAGWAWDVALLQEVPPWWPPTLGTQLGADWALVLTSRNFGLPLRRMIATRWPDTIRSNGGGCNAILVRRAPSTRAPEHAQRLERPGVSIAEQRTRRLTWWPERRWLLGVRLAALDRLWVGNVHLTGGHGDAAVREARAAAATILAWADGAPVILGGDFNLPLTVAPGRRVRRRLSRRPRVRRWPRCSPPSRPCSTTAGCPTTPR